MVNGLDGAVGLHVPFPVEVVLATREGPVIRLLLNMAENTVPVAVHIMRHVTLDPVPVSTML